MTIVVTDERLRVLRHKFDTMLGGGTVVTEFHCRDVADICAELLSLRSLLAASREALEAAIEASVFISERQCQQSRHEAWLRTITQLRSLAHLSGEAS